MVARVPAPPGPCYWLVASGTPWGWRGGCLAAGLVRSTVCYYCPGGCSALAVCALRSQQVWGVKAGACSRSSLPSRPSQCVLRVVLSGCPFPSLPASHSLRSVRSAGSVWLPFWSMPRVCLVWVRWCSHGVCASPPPPPGFVWRAHYARFGCRAPVGPFQAVHAPPRLLLRSRAPPI